MADEWLRGGGALLDALLYETGFDLPISIESASPGGAAVPWPSTPAESSHPASRRSLHPSLHPSRSLRRVGSPDADA